MTDKKQECQNGKPRRRKTDQGIYQKIDGFLESRTSTIMGWFWKSGLFLFLIGLILQNLSFQKENSEKLVENTADIRIMSESSKRLISAIKENKICLNDVQDQVNNLTTSDATNKKDIQYLRRDVDHLIKKKGVEYMSTVEQIRALIADPEGEDEIFDDDHYNIIIDIESNPYRAAASAARSIAAHFAKQVAVTAGPVKIENQQKALRYQELAEDYDARAREGGGSTDGSDIIGAAGIIITGIDTVEMDDIRDIDDRYNSTFYRGIHDNDGEY